MYVSVMTVKSIAPFGDFRLRTHLAFLALHRLNCGASTHQAALLIF